MRLKRLKRKSETKIVAKKLMISTTLISTSIFLSAQLINGTEAMFVSAIGGNGEVNSAIVFPVTIEEIVDRMNENYRVMQMILSTSNGISSIEEGQLLIEQIYSVDSTVESIRSDYQLIDKYHTEIQEKFANEDIYDFVRDSYNNAISILDNSEQIYSSKDQVIELISTEIQQLQQPQLVEENSPIEEMIEQIPEEVIEEPIEIPAVEQSEEIVDELNEQSPLEEQTKVEEVTIDEE